MLEEVKMRAIGLRVQARMAEKTKRILLEQGLLDARLTPERDNGFVVFPLTSMPRNQFPDIVGGEVLEFEFSRRPTRPTSLKDELRRVLTDEELKDAPSSFDIIGDIAVVHIPENLASKASLIGEAILRVQRSVRVVLGESGRVEGTYRVRRYIHLAGEERTQTIHRENGCLFFVDLSRVYYTPRLSGERLRIASLVSSDEVVADMFAGVGPFAITIAKRSGALVYASELNPAAYELLVKNIEVNRLSGRVTPIFGDCREVFRDVKRRFDRVIMNFPSDPLSFLSTALTILKEKGTIHLYGFAESPDDWERLVEDRVKSLGASCSVSAKRLRPISPKKSLHVADVEIN